MKNLKRLLLLLVLIAAVAGLLWWMTNSTNNATKTFTGKIVKIEGNVITLYGRPTYGDDYEKSYNTPELEVQVTVTDKTEYKKSVLNLPPTGQTYDPSKVNRTTEKGSLADLQGQEIMLEVEASSNVYNRKTFKADTITYNDFR